MSPSTGFTGGDNIITINGAGFSSQSNVMIGSAPCYEITNSPTQVTCLTTVAPAGDYSVMIMNFDNSSGVSPQPFKYRADAFSQVDLMVGVLNSANGTATVYADGVGPAAHLFHPASLTGDGTNIYLADFGFNVIRRLNFRASSITRIAGNIIGGSPGAEKDGPPIATTTTCDQFNAETTCSYFEAPSGIAMEGGNLYVTDDYGCTIRKVSLGPGGLTATAVSTVQGTANTCASTVTALAGPGGTVASNGALYIADSSSHTIRKFDIATKTLSTVAGTLGMSGYSDTGTGLLNGPDGIALLGGFLYVADYSNYVIRSVNLSTGVVSTVAGNPSFRGTKDGAGTAAHFAGPNGLATDGTYLYVTDISDNVIRKIDVSQTPAVVTTIAGQVGVANDAPGTLATATFNGLNGIYYHPSMGLFVSTMSVIFRIH